MNTFGSRFRITVFGESHGSVTGVVMDGVKPGIELAAADFTGDLDRRRSGALGTTTRRESDLPEIVSGLYDSRTTGAPLTVVFSNNDTRSADYAGLAGQPRPSHADFAAAVKYRGFNDPRGGGQFSGRMTLALVAAGVVARKILGESVKIEAAIAELGGSRDPEHYSRLIAEARQEGDSLGGIISCAVTGIPAGLGEPFFDSVESLISHLLFSIPGVKGVEFGSGFAGASLRGSENNDAIISADGKTSTNNSGGINGGITNGNHITFRVAVKPTPSISILQKTYNFHSGRLEPLVVAGRHDACIALRMPVIVESVAAVALAQF